MQKEFFKNRLKFFIVSSFFALMFLMQSKFAYSQTVKLTDFLRNRIQLSENELTEMRQGNVVVKLLKTKLRREIAVLGIVKMNVPKEYFVENYHDSDIFIETLNAVEKGRFSNLPALKDVQDLTLDEGDVKAIKECKPGDCNIKMSSEAMAYFQRKVDWSAPDYKEQVKALFRQKMIQYVASYLVGGNEAMAEFDDQKYPLRLVDEFHDLLKDSQYLFDYAPKLHKYLEDYPAYKLPNTENFIYWSKDDIETKRRVINITHVTIYKPRNQNLFNIYIASKKIYASHYFEADLGLTAIENVSESAGVGIYFLYLKRARIDSLRHPHFGGILRKKVRGGLKKMLKKNLQTLKELTENNYELSLK